MLCFTSCGSAPSSGPGARPAWVDNISSVYGRDRYVAAAGYAQDRQSAEKNALSNLSAFFGQSIQSDQTVKSAYYEAARSGAMTEWIESTEIENAVRTVTSMDTLIGAEIREVWYDEYNKIYYAAAVMERQRTIQLYTKMIADNLAIIKNLSDSAYTQGNTLEAVSGFRFAAAAADINADYAIILNALGAPVPQGVVSGDQYRLEALNIIRAIPVGITVTGDRAGRLQSAFAKVLSAFGFRTGSESSRYVLYAGVTADNPEYPGSPYQWIQMELNASLTDTLSQSVLLPYSFHTREGHTTAALAENRAFTTAEQEIESAFTSLLSSYLDHLLLKN